MNDYFRIEMSLFYETKDRKLREALLTFSLKITSIISDVWVQYLKNYLTHLIHKTRNWYHIVPLWSYLSIHGYFRKHHFSSMCACVPKWGAKVYQKRLFKVLTWYLQVCWTSRSHFKPPPSSSTCWLFSFPTAANAATAYVSDIDKKTFSMFLLP